MPVTVEAHARVMTWAVAVATQVERVQAGRLAFMVSSKAIMARRYYDGDEDARPSRLLAADTHLLLVAAGQFEMSLRHFDGDLRLPDGLTRHHLRAMRDAFEHWDKRGQRAQKRVAKFTDDPTSNEWRADGSGRIGKVVHDDVVKQWANDVYAALLNFDVLRAATEM